MASRPPKKPLDMADGVAKLKRDIRDLYYMAKNAGAKMDNLERIVGDLVRLNEQYHKERQLHVLLTELNTLESMLAREVEPKHGAETAVMTLERCLKELHRLRDMNELRSFSDKLAERN
jgi:hypothetical protein